MSGSDDPSAGASPLPGGDEIEALLEDIERARARVTERVESMDTEVAARRPGEGAWSPAEVVEHLVLAEDFGIRGLWKIVLAVRAGEGPAPVAAVLAARSVEEAFVDVPDRVDAPPPVQPTGKGTARYWCERLRANGWLLRRLAAAMAEIGLDRIVMPHFIAGPLDGRQRLQFIRWHLERHLAQIERGDGV